MGVVAPAIEGDAAPQTTRVLLVAPPARGGLARHVMALLAGLDEAGYPVGVACDPEGPILAVARERGLPSYPMSLSPGGGPPRAAVMAVRLSRAIGAMGAHIVHSHSFTAGLVAALALQLVRAKGFVATVHNYPPDADGMRPRRRRDRWAMGLLCRQANRIIAVSEALRRDLLEACPDARSKCVTIPNGIHVGAAIDTSPEDARRSLGVPAGGPVVGMIARFAPQKGIADFVRAAAVLAKCWPELSLVLAGDGPLRPEALSLRRELGIENRLLMPGEVRSSREFLLALDVLVITSLSEGSSIAAMEAMALGKPVVATAVGGVPEVVADQETGLLVPPGDPEAVAAAVSELLEDPERAAAMGRNGRRRAVEHFGVHQMLARTKQVYADVLRKGLGHRGPEGQ